MAQTAGAVRFVYNLALEQRATFHRQAKAAGIRLNYVSQGREITQLRRECDWLASVAYRPLTNALRDLDKAFTAFFRGGGFPKFRNARDNVSFRHSGHEVNIGEPFGRWVTVSVPKVGPVRMRLTRQWIGRVVSVTFRRDALGWHASLGCEAEHETPPSSLPAVGIDRGVANTLALSTGEMLSIPAMTALVRRKKRAQRILARRVRDSNRHRKQRLRLTRIAAKIARCRADWRHKATTGIANRFGLVAIEDLNTVGMTRAGSGKRGLNRAILEQGWRGIETALAYKLEERGGTLVKINPAYTSQECSSCGAIDKRSRESQAGFACRHCGFTGHADVNAAMNILRRSTPSVEGRGYSPVEARTGALAA